MTSSTAASEDGQEIQAIKEMIILDKGRYQKKGFGIVVAACIWFLYFYFAPDIIRHYWHKLRFFEDDNYNVPFVQTMIHNTYFIIGTLAMTIIYRSKIEFFERYRVNKNTKWPWEEDPKVWKETLRKTIIILFLNEIFRINKYRN